MWLGWQWGHEYGAVPKGVFIVGFVIFCLGSLMNQCCHVMLQVKKKETPPRKRFVHYHFPFQYFVMPHYTAEMATWFGFSLCCGVNTSSILIWLLSLVCCNVGPTTGVCSTSTCM